MQSDTSLKALSSLFSFRPSACRTAHQPFKFIAVLLTLIYLSFFQLTVHADSIITTWRSDPALHGFHFQSSQIPLTQVIQIGNHWTATIQAPKDASLTKLLLAARQHPEIISAEQNQRAQVSLIPDDQSFTDNAFNQAHHTQINSTDAWDARTDCSDVVVAVVDTGIDVDHPDLITNLWQNTDEIPDNGIDDDNNGYIDDVNGACVRSSCINNQINDGFGHGSHVAGLIAAQGNNATGVTGACWNARLMIVKSLGDTGSGSVSDVAAGILYAINNGADIVNASLTISSFSSTLKSVVEQANQQGILIVTAAGNFASNNDQTPVYPASFRNSYDNLMAIANVNGSGALHTNSNFGSESVDFAAPGVSLFSTWKNGQYANSTGTSMSAPLVSGVAALMLAENTQSDVSIKAGLLASGTPSADLDWQMVSPVVLDANASLVNSGTAPLALFRATANDGSYQLFGYDLNTVNRVTFTEPLTSGEQETEFTSFNNHTSQSLSVTLPDETKSGIFQLHSPSSSSNQLFIKRTISAPSNLAFTRNETQVTLSWSTPLNADQVRIERGEPGGAFTEIATLSAPANVYQDTVNENVSYYYRIRGSYDYVHPRTSNVTTESSAYSSTIITQPEDANSFSYWLTETLPSVGLGSNIKIQLAASSSGDYELTAGALPTGLSLSESGLITGTVTSTGTFNFSITFQPNGSSDEDEKPFTMTVNNSSAGIMQLTDQQSLTIQMSASTGTLSSVQALSLNNFSSLSGLSVQLVQQILISDLPVSASETSEITLTINDSANGQFTDVYLANNNNQWLSSAEIANSQVASETASILVEDGSEFDLDNQVNGEIVARVASVSASETTSSSSGSDSRCFIASAVYSNGHQNLSTLRQFRDNVLAKLPGGGELINYYYQASPKAVVWMQDHPALLNLTRSVISLFSAILRAPGETLFFALILLFAWRTYHHRRTDYITDKRS